MKTKLQAFYYRAIDSFVCTISCDMIGLEKTKQADVA